MASLRLNIAVGSDGLTILSPGEAAPRFLAGVVDPSAEGSAVLARLFDTLEEDLFSGDGHRPGDSVLLRIALLPPLCDVRLLDLPGLRDDEIERVVRRDSGRHFLTGGRSVTVGGVRMEPGGATKAGTAPVLAAAAPSALLDTLESAAGSRGWEIDRIVPAHASWWDALETARAPGARKKIDRARRMVVASLYGTLHLMMMEEDGSGSLRRIPASEEDELRKLISGAAGVALLLAPAEQREGLSAIFHSAGWVVAQTRMPLDAREEAARGADEALPELIPPFIARKRTSRERGFTSRALVAAALLLIVAAGIYYWGAARAYASVRAERDEIRAEVQPALAARDSLDRLLARIEEMTALGGTSGWTAFIVELSVMLPPETHLQSLRAVGDTVVIEGAGGRAGEALEALRATPLLRDVQLEGPIMRELEGGTTARERFTVSAIRVPEATRGGRALMQSAPIPAPDAR